MGIRVAPRRRRESSQRAKENGGYIKDIKPNTTWEQFKKKHPEAGITKKGFESLKPPKYRRTYRGVELTEREVKKGGIVRPTSPKPRTVSDADRDAEGKYLNRNDGGIARKTRTF
jgi:rubredoxin